MNASAVRSHSPRDAAACPAGDEKTCTPPQGAIAQPVRAAEGIPKPQGDPDAMRSHGDADAASRAGGLCNPSAAAAQGRKNGAAPKAFVPPTVEMVDRYIRQMGYTFTAEAFVDHYQSKDWRVGRERMADWQAACRSWAHQRAVKTAAGVRSSPSMPDAARMAALAGGAAGAYHAAAASFSRPAGGRVLNAQAYTQRPVDAQALRELERKRMRDLLDPD